MKNKMKIIKTAIHEIKHALMAETLGVDVYEISIAEEDQEEGFRGFCSTAWTKSSVVNLLIDIAPYAAEKDFTYKNLMPYAKKQNDISESIKFLASLEEDEFEVIKNFINIFMFKYKELILQASTKLVEKKRLTYNQWQDILEECHFKKQD